MLDQYRSAMGQVCNQHPMLKLALLYHRVPSERPSGDPLSFRNFPFLVDVYKELPTLEDMVAQKCTQVGWTESILVFMVMQAGLRGRRFAYVMPHDGLLKSFVQERVQGMIDRVPYYRDISRAEWRDRTAENVTLRQYGNGSWRFLGSRTASSLKEFTTDCICIDEYDECEQKHLPMAKDRIRASSSPQFFRMSNPTRPGRGISVLYQNSDRCRWHHKCTRCGERQPLDWWVNIIERDAAGRWMPRDRERYEELQGIQSSLVTPENDIRPVCRRCDRPFDRYDAKTCWVAEEYTNSRRGYHISQMDVPIRPIWRLFEEWGEAQDDADKLRLFYSGVLGLPYEAKGASVTIEDLRGSVDESMQLDYAGGPDYEHKTVVMGVDVGAVLNISVAYVESLVEDGKVTQIRRGIWVGAVKTFEEIEDCLRRYHVDVCVIDSRPELHKCQEFRNHIHESSDIETRVWLCQYLTIPKVSGQKYGMKLNHQSYAVSVDRTAVMDTTYADIRRRFKTFPADVFHVFGFADQMRAPMRVLSPKGDRFRWDEGSKADHYRHADTYERVAMDLLDQSGGLIEIDLRDFGW